MSRPAQMAQLHQLTRLVLDLRLATLEAAERARQNSLRNFADLEVPAAEEMSLIADALASQRYQQWADVRRAEINRTLARQTAEWMEATDAARLAFGRSEALSKLLDKAR